MNATDLVIVGILAISVLIGLWRGLIAELLSVVIWVAAFWVAATFGADLAAQFEHSISMPMARLALGYGLCFFGVLVLGAIIRFVTRRLIWGSGLSGIDRLFGMLFGFVRGVLLVTLMVFLIGLTGLTRDPWWQQSALLPQFQGMAAWLGQNVPASLRDHLHPEAILDKIKPEQVIDHLHGLSTRLPSLPAQLPKVPTQLPAGLPAPLHAPIVGRPMLPVAPVPLKPAAASSAASSPQQIF
jgi:membrane protein required for colicin V production